jgi:hypothetical protein
MMPFPYNMMNRIGYNTAMSLLAAFMLLLLVPVSSLAQSPTPLNLGCAENFAILAGSTITNTGYSIIDGDVGLVPGSATTGFPPAIVVNGSIHINDALATYGKICLNTAYNEAAGRTPIPTGSFLNPGAGNIGGLTLVPGLYKFTSSATLTGNNVILAGGANDVWIFQIGSNLDVGDAVQVVLSGGAQAKNVFWQVGTSATLGTSSVVKGTIMADQSISLNTGAQLDGRALARIGAVTLDRNTVTRPPLASMSPTVIHTIPSSSSIGVAVSQNITATFSEAMDAMTITEMTFTLRQGNTPVSGVVSYVGETATFDPTVDLLPSTVYTATITTGALNTIGTALAGDHIWTFTTAIGPDMTPPTVSYTVPAFGAINVPVNQRISVTFSEEMSKPSFTTSSFMVYAGAIPVAGTVSVEGITATFIPSTNLAPNTLYTATVTTGAKDLAGNPLASGYSWLFTTGPFSDTNPPSVSSTVPTNSATLVPVNQILIVSFSEALDPSTINSSTFIVRLGTDAIAGSVAYAGVTAIFTPALPLNQLRTYSATITTGVRDLAGNPLAANYIWYFTTSIGRDTTAPAVSYTIPSNGATGVHENSSVSATFSEAMDPQTIHTLSFVLHTGAVPIAGTVTYTGMTARFTPTAKLLYNTRYTATLTNMVRDLAGNALLGSFSWSFTTGSMADTTGPSVISTMPANAALNVPVNQKVLAMFSEAIDPLTLTTASFTLMAGNTPIQGTVAYVGITAVFTPHNALTFSTVYTARISANVKDLAGNAMNGDFVWYFVSSADIDYIAPMVRYTVPLDTATGVPVNQKIAAVFSEPMDPQYISTATFTLKSGMNSVTGMVSYAGRTATFSPAVDLAFRTTYTASIAAVVRDLAGNAMLADHVWSFTTGESPDFILPAVVSTEPANNEDGVALNKILSVTFSKEMDPMTISSNFTLKQDGVLIPGYISYAERTATFTPFVHLLPYTSYDAVLRSGAMDLAANAIQTDYMWKFKTGGLLPGPVVLELGCVADFTLFSGSTITNTGSTVIQGNLGLSPGTTLNGFPPGQILNGAMHINDALAISAKLCLSAAYNDAANRTLNAILLSDGELGGRTLPPGLYRSAPGYFRITHSDLVLDAQGDPNAVWIFQMPSSILEVADGRKVLLGSGAQARNIFWQVGSSATLGAAVVMSGTIMANHAITLMNGAVLNGRAFAGNASITLSSNIIRRPDIAVSVGTETAPPDFTLSQNYPNPFNPATQIAYGIATAGLVSLRIYNVLGIEVATLVNEYQEAGNYVVTFNPKDSRRSLSSGVYFYRLVAGDAISLSKSLILQN